MFRHSWALVVLLITGFGLVAETSAQTPASGTPSTAYRQKGKWVGYVPTHQRFAGSETSQVFGRSLPDITSCLASVSKEEAAPPSPTFEASPESAEPFEGALLDSEGMDEKPQVLAVAFDDPTSGLDPTVESVPVFDPGVEVMGDACQPGCNPCGVAPACYPSPRFYWNADYLLWWLGGMATPPLVTTSPAGTVQNAAGVLGQPGTSILFGGSDPDNDSLSGGRFSLGMWLDPCQSQGLEVHYFALGTQTASFGASDEDYAILARPFYNTVDGQQDARLIVYDSLVSGSLAVTASTNFEGGEFLFRRAVRHDCWGELDLFAGYRWLQLEDSLLIEETTESLVTATAGTTYDLFDRLTPTTAFTAVSLACHSAGSSLHVGRWNCSPNWQLER